MPPQLDQSAYWDQVAESKTFSHPIDWDMFSTKIGKQDRILDYGCGYGRSCAALIQKGYTQVWGLDSSQAMIRRAAREVPAAHFQHLPSPQLPFPDHSFEAVLLFAVLTCIPFDADQQQLIGELQRVLAPGGYLYISDLLLNDDARNQSRYHQYAEKYGNYGVFELPEGAVCRHHTQEHFYALMQGQTPAWEQRFAVTTMNGNSARAIQMVWRNE